MSNVQHTMVMKPIGAALFVCALALAMTACGDDTSNDDSSADPLAGTEWQVEMVTEGDVARPPPVEGVSIVFYDDGRVGVDLGCNTGSGNYTIEGDGFDADQIGVTEMFCEDREDWFVLAEAITAATGWSIDDDTLRLDGADYTVVASFAGSVPPTDDSIDPDTPVTSD